MAQGELRTENLILRTALRELEAKIEANEALKPRSCQYCQNYVQHYIKGGIAFNAEYVPIYEGHCTAGVPISKGGKKKPKPDETCPYFKSGTHDMKYIRKGEQG